MIAKAEQVDVVGVIINPHEAQGLELVYTILGQRCFGWSVLVLSLASAFPCSKQGGTCRTEGLPRNLWGSDREQVVGASLGSTKPPPNFIADTSDKPSLSNPSISSVPGGSQCSALGPCGGSAIEDRPQQIQPDSRWSLNQASCLPKGDVGKDAHGVGPAGARPSSQAQGKPLSATASRAWNQA